MPFNIVAELLRRSQGGRSAAGGPGSIPGTPEYNARWGPGGPPPETRQFFGGSAGTTGTGTTGAGVTGPPANYGGRYGENEETYREWERRMEQLRKGNPITADFDYYRDRWAPQEYERRHGRPYDVGGFGESQGRAGTSQRSTQRLPNEGQQGRYRPIQSMGAGYGAGGGGFGDRYGGDFRNFPIAPSPESPWGGRGIGGTRARREYPSLPGVERRGVMPGPSPGEGGRTWLGSPRANTGLPRLPGMPGHIKSRRTIRR